MVMFTSGYSISISASDSTTTSSFSPLGLCTNERLVCFSYSDDLFDRLVTDCFIAEAKGSSVRNVLAELYWSLVTPFLNPSMWMAGIVIFLSLATDDPCEYFELA